MREIDTGWIARDPYTTIGDGGTTIIERGDGGGGCIGDGGTSCIGDGGSNG